ncbi:hypothetical protein CC78DRAFT_5175 [Lojkania enalia]|uniref:C2H2-type domain-containing protein n=1 Tax=Lojkania enalia TaxID=147567 RepID=A0A9P4TRQ6_9PLEO|nr:hypothetical protein CC78DRAFT_5175 [Didymosphaeria enalia]
MALKRKNSFDDNDSSRYKSRRGLLEDDNDDFSDDSHIKNEVSDDEKPLYVPNDDPLALFTNAGKLRAPAEANRPWEWACDFEGCGRRFNRPSRLEEHKRVHANIRPFACAHDGCGKTFPRKDHLNRHVESAHGGVPTHICEFKGCGKAFFVKARLKKHQETHTNKYYCTGYPPCEEVFRKKKTLEAHINSTHLGKKAYRCTFVDEETGDVCGKEYDAGGGLKNHIIKKHIKREQEHKYQCLLCPCPNSTEFDIVTRSEGEVRVAKEPLGFLTHLELLAHNREFHPITCSGCGKVCRTNAELRSHKEVVHGEFGGPPKFPCPRPGCDRIFTKGGNLKVHIAAVHDELRRFVCGEVDFSSSKHPELAGWDRQNACNQAFKTKSALEQHIRVLHLGFQNRKTERDKKKASLKQTKGKTKTTTLTLLTGVGYGEGKDIPCLVDGCSFKFTIEYHLAMHLSGFHKLSDEDVESMLEEQNAEKEALSGGPFWLGGYDETLSRQHFESTDPSLPQTPNSFETPATPWIVHDQNLGPQLSPLDDQLEIDEAEAEMDKEMGLTDMPASDIRHGLQCDPAC